MPIRQEIRTMDNRYQLVSPCGVNCGDCPAYLAKSDPLMLKKMLSLGFSGETLPCPGCRSVKGKCLVIGGDCETYKCFEKRRINYCYECDAFPCDKFNPAVDKASLEVQNLKVFNLCFIQKHGTAKWLQKSAEIKKRYFLGKLVYGKGPQLQ